jgi:hypothetical protein
VEEVVMTEYAFPNDYFDRNLDGVRTRPGMTLRDYFAGQVLAGLDINCDYSAAYTAQWAYELAEAMLKERGGG